jgi:hypothetical protein
MANIGVQQDQRSIARQPLTAGELAEALLFYKDVHIVFNETNLTKLARAWNASPLGYLISSEYFRRILREWSNWYYD